MGLFPSVKRKGKEYWPTGTISTFRKSAVGNSLAVFTSTAAGMGSIPGWGTKIPYNTEQLSLNSATTEPRSYDAHDETKIPHAAAKT